ncbi:hypothetical protein [Streptomyces enissocaesilis]|uniref:Histidine kinase n=1 Tax=Streptomyces enissocaesilis TaxID=332589 RepID=A0ABN3WRT6_9ACTN
MRTVVDVLVRAAVATWVLWTAYGAGLFRGVAAVAPAAGPARCAAAARAYDRLTARNRLRSAVGTLAVVALVGAGPYAAGARTPASILWIVCAVQAMERLPLAAALPVAVPGTRGAAHHDRALESVLLGRGIVLVGHSPRLDTRARGAGFRLLAQKRTARAAQARSAALAERARTAREVHDVLAHGLSAAHIDHLLAEAGGE